ncbi:MAG: bile acid:sodium symporter [Bacteroidota bacterium]
MKPYIESILLILAIIAGSLTGLFTSYEASLTDFFIIAMLFLLFYNMSPADFFEGIKNKKYIGIALLSNFVIIPIIAYLACTVFVDKSSVIFSGLIIYLVAPCTDWFLGFTKLAKGDVKVNSALLPLNLLLQFLFLPVYLHLFTSNRMAVPMEVFLEVFIFWVLLPFLAAQITRWIVQKFAKGLLVRTNAVVEILLPITIVLLVFTIFNSNVESVLENVAILPKVFVVIVTFFIATFFVSRFIARRSTFSRGKEISLIMTTAARNAPLMLLVSLLFFPDQPLIHLILVIGMLVEFPHLITITYLLKR